MNESDLLAPLRAMQERISVLEQRLMQRTNALIFLVIRVVLMSAMVVGFSWYTLELSP